MATVTWKGGKTAVAQVASGTIDSGDAASTYTVTIGGVTVSVAGNASTTTVATDLATACNAETHPYFAAITWSDSTGTLTATADTAGVPFTAALSVAGGTGTVTDFSDTTACTGPHHADEVENWSSGALPTTSDDIEISAGPSLLYGLGAISSTALGRATVRQTFTGLVGLEHSAFATSLDGATLDDSVIEYRATHLELTADEIVIGEYIGPDTPAGSQRLCIEQKKAGASVLDVINTSATALNGRPAVRYLAANASADLVVRAAPGGVGVAVEEGQTSTIGDVYLADDATSTSVYIGPGTTLTSYTQVGGTGVLAAAATITTVDVYGGTLSIAGYDYVITTLSVHEGTVVDGHENTGGAEWTTVNVYGGTLELPRATTGTRAYTTLNLYGGTVEADWAGLTGTEVVATPAELVGRRAVAVTAL